MRRVRHWFEYLTFRSLELLVRLTPRPLGLFVGRRLGTLIHFLDKKRRNLTLRQMAFAFPDWSEEKVQATCLQAFQTFGAIVMDVVAMNRLLGWPVQRSTQVRGRHHLEHAVRSGKGYFLMSAHYGNWEWVALLQGAWDCPLSLVTRPLDNPLLEDYLGRRRTLSDNEIIHKQNAVRPMMSAIKNKRGVAIVVDQDYRRGEAVFVELFGKQAAMTPSLAKLHLKTGAPILPVFCVLDGTRYRVQYFEPYWYKATGDEETDIRGISQDVAAMIEAAIRRHPEQWLWMHDRWRTRPPEEVGEDAGTMAAEGDS